MAAAIQLLVTDETTGSTREAKTLPLTDGLIARLENLSRKRVGPKALLAALELRARKAGLEAHGNASFAYRSQFSGRRPSYLEACEADRMNGVLEAFTLWYLDESGYVFPDNAVRLENRLWEAFRSGWGEGKDGE